MSTTLAPEATVIEPKAYRIIRLEASDVLRLKAVEIEPSGNLVVLGGENGQGKTSVLNAIEMALGGGDSIPRMPIRNGKTKGHVVVDLGELVVERTFTAKGTALVVKSRDGAKYSSPQKILDGLVGKLSFDPLAFKGMDRKAQRDTLQKLVGLDFTTLDLKRRAAFDNRTSVNKRVNEAEARTAGKVKHADAPATEVSAKELMETLKQQQRTNKVHADQRKGLDDARTALKAIDDDILERAKELQRLLAELEARKEDRKKQDELVTVIVAECEALKDEDTEATSQKIADADEQNRKLRENASLAEELKKLEADRKLSKALTTEIEDCDRSRIEQLSEAKFPVAGLAFDDDGVTLNGIPFEQVAETDSLKVSCAMGLAQHPQLRVMLIRNAPYIGEATFKTLAEIAEENDAQLWLEQGGQGSECTVILEDGTAKEVEPEPAVVA